MNFLKNTNNKLTTKSIMSKTILKQLLLLLMLFSLLLFNSCQEEGIELLTEEEDQLVVAESNVAMLMQNTAARDGSADNIIDNASCTEIVLPVTVFVNGLEIIIDSEEDFEVIEEIYDQLEDDEDKLDIVFPITIILSNHDEITIENENQLNELIAECSGENEDDDDIECVDFVYPLTYVVFDTESSETSTVIINNDRDMYRFLKNIDKNDVISLQFPVSLIYSDGEEVTVQNLEQLEEVLTSAIDFCDEDDDNDYGDDDFDIERLNELLVICPWSVQSVLRNNDDLNNEFRDYVVVFQPEGVAKIRRKNGEIITGTWETEETDSGVKLTLKFEDSDVFTLTWYVAELGYGKIRLYNEDGNRIVLHKNCDILFEFNAERIENILKECLWRVHRLQVDGVEHEAKYYGTPLKFEDNGVVKLRVLGEQLTGYWDVIPVNTGFILKIELEGRPELKLEWFVKVLENDVVKLENQNSEMILKRDCPGDDDVYYIEDVLISSLWGVAYFEDDSENQTALFYDYVLDFKETGRIHVEKDNQSFAGSWLAYRYDGQLKLGMNFSDNDPFFTLNNRWKIVEITQDRIELKDYDSNGNIEKKLVLERHE